MSNLEKLININERKGFPRTYHFNRFIRWFSLTLGTAAMVYSVWFIFNRVGADDTTFKKMAPFLILFFTMNTVTKNLFTLNAITFTEQNIKFSFLARKPIVIYWKDFQKMTFSAAKPKGIKIFYNSNNVTKEFLLTLSFSNMLEIVNSIAEMVPEISYDKFLQNVIISDQEKEEYWKRKKSETT